MVNWLKPVLAQASEMHRNGAYRQATTVPAPSKGSSIMPVALLNSPPVPLSAPLSRTEDAVIVPSSCQACSAPCGAGWVKRDGAGVLVHRSGEDCPVAVPFDWNTGAPLREHSLLWTDAVLGRAACPGCSGVYPNWTRVAVDGLEILTHDGNTICPGDPTFGALTGPEPTPTPVTGVAA